MKNRFKQFTVKMLVFIMFCLVLFPTSVDAKGIQMNKQLLVQRYCKSQGIQVTPQFTSGGSTHTHQYIVSNALTILKNDQGYSLLNNSTNTSTLKTYTDWPDKIGNESDSATFSGHFYNPYTGKSWTGSKTKNAMTRATGYFNDALTQAKQGNMEEALVLIGKGTHYVSDMNEPHHASNLTALNSNHSAFEKYVDQNLSSFYISGNTLDVSLYTEAKEQSISKILKDGAFYAYDLQYMAQEKDTYFEAADLCVKHAIVNVAQYLYAFGIEAGIYQS